MQAHRQSFEGQLEQLAPIRAFVCGAAKELGADEEDAFAFELVADEAATNAFEHAYGGDPGKVEVAIWRDGEELVLRLRNWGEPFDPKAVPEPDVTRPLEERPVGGLGVFLMRKFTDALLFEFDPVEGNTTTARRRLKRAVENNEGEEDEEDEHAGQGVQSEALRASDYSL